MKKLVKTAAAIAASTLLLSFAACSYEEGGAPTDFNTDATSTFTQGQSKTSSKKGHDYSSSKSNGSNTTGGGYSSSIDSSKTYTVYFYGSAEGLEYEGEDLSGMIQVAELTEITDYIVSGTTVTLTKSGTDKVYAAMEKYGNSSGSN